MSEAEKWTLRNSIAIFAAMYLLLALIGGVKSGGACVGFVGYCCGRNWGIMEKNKEVNGKPGGVLAMFLGIAIAWILHWKGF